MPNVFEKIEHGVETAGKEVLHAVELPVKFLVAAEHVIADAIKEQPAVKSAVIDLVKQAEAVIADVGIAAGEKGINLVDDAKALSAAESFFAYFRSDFVPLMSNLYSELKADVQ